MTATVATAERAATNVRDAHEGIFRSGAYVSQFQPEAEKNPFRGLYAQKRAAVIASVSGEDRRVLDIGGGMGRMAIPLSARHRVVMCDVSLPMLAAARAAGAPAALALCAATASALPFADRSFDCILCIDVLPHLPRPLDVLHEIRRVLAPGGKLLIDSTNAVPLWTLSHPRYVGRHPGRWVATWRAGGVLPEWSHRVHHLRRGPFLGLLWSAGFEVVAVRRFGAIPFVKWHLATALRP